MPHSKDCPYEELSEKLSAAGCPMEGDGRSRIPSLLKRSASVRVRGERHPVAAPSCCSSSSHPAADADSMGGSTASLASCGSSATHQPSTQPVVPAVETAVSCHRRGSCRSVLHCQRPVDTETYLTPTQRKDRELRQLRAALARATSEARLRDERLRQLTMQLQALQAGSSPPQGQDGVSSAEGASLGDSGISSDVRTVPEETEPAEEEEHSGPHSAEAAGIAESHELPATDESDDSTESFPEEGTRRRSSGSSSETLRRKYRQLKHRYEQRTESLLQMLGDLNSNPLVERPPVPCDTHGPPPSSRHADALWQHVSTCQSTHVTRYLELRPAYESTQERLRHLERELSEARAEIEKQERWHSEMYLKMYRKGQEAAQFERNEELQHRAEAASSALPAGGPFPGTERQAEYTLRFLKDAVFYFLTDRSDCRGHLSAIQSILGFSEAERAAVAKAWRHRGRL